MKKIKICIKIKKKKKKHRKNLFILKNNHSIFPYYFIEDKVGGIL